MPVKLIAPESGFTMIRSTMHIVKNSPNADLAAECLNQAISPSVQAQMAEAPNYLVPTSSRASFSKGP
jgi:putative spermidine/putrescine transport system substrate-binding protein